MSDHAGRTAAEREAARREREARRAGRTEAPNGTAHPPVEEEYVYEPYEPPAGTRRVGGAADPGARPARTGAPRLRRPSWGGRTLALIAFLFVGVLGWFVVSLWQPLHGAPGAPVTVTIPAHSSASEVGSLLERDGVISSSFFFEIRATLAGDRGDLRSGTYTLRRNSTYGAVLTALTTPPPPIPTTELTITEGKSRRQIDALLRAQGVRGSYLAVTHRDLLIDRRQYNAPHGTPTLEGFLFPATYTLRTPIDVQTLVDKQVVAFKRAFATVNLAYARHRHLTAYDVLIIASIIEKEAATAHDRPLVASVIYNRLKARMPLGMDSTTRYEFNDYTHPLTAAELAANSPYNTRRHAGLPPTPIGNPGLAAIEAAAHPAKTNYYYFVVKPCGNGASVFSSTYAQFLSDSARYQSARAQRGGNSPESC